MPRSLPSVDFRAILHAIDEGPSDLYAVVGATLKFLLVAGLLAAMAIGIQTTSGLRSIAAVFICLFLLLLIWKIPKWGAIFTFAFLVILGGLRRWLIFDFGWLGFDPLILIAPVITILCFLQLLIARKVPTDTPLSKSLKYLLIIMGLQVFNPAQGGLLVGFGGILYYIAPLLWFYVGRTYGSNQIIMAIFKTAVLAFSITAIYGMKQVFLGISSSEQLWLDTVGRGSMSVSANALRVFSTFASQQEYALTLACGISICAGFIFHKKFIFFLPLVILIPALLYTGARGPIVNSLATVSVQWALMGKSRSVWLPRFVLALVIAVGGTAWSLSSIDTTKMDAAQADILRHQKAGLLDPGSSDAGDHVSLILGGYSFGLTHPMGAGLGATTLAAGKLGGGGIGGAESDNGNMFISLGGIGGILYLVICFLVFKQVLAAWTYSRNPVFLILGGLLVTTFGQWLAGGLYSLCLLNFFCIGAMDAYCAKNPEVLSKKTREPVTSGSTLQISRSGRVRGRAVRPQRGLHERPLGGRSFRHQPRLTPARRRR